MKTKKRTYRSYQEFLLENLQDPREAAVYLKAALADEDERVFLIALRDVLQAIGFAMDINPIRK